MSEGKLRDTVNIGQKAKQLLENELLNRWWEDASTSLFRQFKNTRPHETDRLLELSALMQSLEGMKRDFTRYVNNGEKAKSKLGEKTLKERISKTVR